MRRIEILSSKETTSSKHIHSNTTFSKTVINRSILMTYDGSPIYVVENTHYVKQMPDLVTPVGYDILLLPVPGHVQIVPSIVSADIWFGEVLIEFVGEVSLTLDDPIALVMAIPRCETAVRVMDGKELQEYENRKKFLSENRDEIATRVENKNGMIVDNAYEVIIKNAKPVGGQAFFRRVVK